MAWLKGALGGLAIACLALALVQYQIPEKYGFMPVIYFIASAPAYISWQINLSEAMLPVAYFSYWVIVGALIGGFLFRHKIWRKLTGVGLAAVVLIMHYGAMVFMGEQIQSSLSILMNLF